MRLIDADRLKTVLETNFGHTGGASVLEQLIDEQPTIQPEVLACGNGELLAKPELKEGYWIGGDGSYICSECNSSPMDYIGTMGASFDAYIETPMNYCPNCGAKMKGE